MSTSSPLDPPPVVHPGDRIGRYFVVDTLGRGGMGIVVRAYDPELDRNLAIKLLNAKTRRNVHDAQKRLLREAQAMASLSHPNVLGVHDVGVWHQHVFIAMEYVDGITLAKWAERRPPIAEVLRVYAAAGRGLAAAHRADLVHRDFKPHNVMIAEDGRVLVLDFGLARAAHSGIDSPSVPSEEDIRISALESLTAEGEVMGTPVYMAPEQHTGSATAASDQYSFCVALYEALTGERPFVGNDLFGLAMQKVQFEIRPFPDRPRVSRAVRAAIRRGLQPEPHERFECMEDLLAALAGRRRFDRLAIGGLLGLTTVAAIGVAALRSASAGPCDGAGSATAAWDDTRRAAVREALLGTGVPYAVETTNTVLGQLDARVDALATAQRQACTATHVDRTQPEAILDLRVACLDRRTSELAALVTVLEDPDRDVIEHAVAATRSLIPVASCDDVERLQQEVPLPDEPVARAEIERLRADVAAAAARLDAGKYQPALDELDVALELSAPLDHPPLHAHIQRHRGDALQQLSEFDRAAEAYLAAAEAATRGGDDRTAAIAHAGAAWTIGHSLGRPDEARGHLRTAEALVERVGSPPELQVEVLLVSGVIAHDQGEFEDGLRHLESARDLEVAGEGASSSVLTDLGRVLHALGRTDEAEAVLLQAVAIAERDQGEAHPQVAKVLAHLGMLLLETGRLEESLAVHRRELAILSAALTEDHLLVAFALTNVAGLEMYLERYDLAAREFERARDIVSQRLGPEHPNVGRLTANLGEVWRLAGDLDRALIEHEASLTNLAGALGADHPDVARTRNNMASVLFSMSRYEDSGREYQVSFDALVAALGEEHPTLAYPLTGIGQTLIELGSPQKAIDPLQRALQLRGEEGVDPFDLGETQLWLARALWNADVDKKRAVELARDARQSYIDAGPGRSEARELAEAWLTERGETI